MVIPYGMVKPHGMVKTHGMVKPHSSKFRIFTTIFSDVQIIPIYKQCFLNLSDVADIDECTVFGEQLCSQICVNTIGSFRCECRQGYRIAQDKRTCIRQSE